MLKTFIAAIVSVSVVGCAPRPITLSYTTPTASTSCSDVKWMLWDMKLPPPGFREQIRRCMSVGESIQVATSLPTAIGTICDKSKPITPAQGIFGPVMVCTYNGQ